MCATLLSSGGALAVEDGASYPGLMCQAVGSAGGVTRDLAGRITNPSTVARLVSCPYQKDVAGTQTIEYAEIIVTNAQTSCTFNSRTREGGQIASRAPSGKGPLGDATVITFAQGDASDIRGGYYYYVQCRLPPQASIVSYAILENQGER